MFDFLGQLARSGLRGTERPGGIGNDRALRTLELWDGDPRDGEVSRHCAASLGIRRCSQAGHDEVRVVLIRGRAEHGDHVRRDPGLAVVLVDPSGSPDTRQEDVTGAENVVAVEVIDEGRGVVPA